MIANPSKFQAIFSTKSKDQQSIDIQIKDKTISSQNEFELLGLTVDENLKFEKIHQHNLSECVWSTACNI